jgi:hypothetical protein
LSLKFDFDIEGRCLAVSWHMVLLWLTFVPSYFKLPWTIKKLWTTRLHVALTMEKLVQGVVHDKSSYYCQHLCEVCLKEIDGWVKYALETNYTLLQSIWICDLDFGDRRPVIIAHGTSSYYFKHVCQIISKSLDLLRSYGPDIQNMTHRLIIVNICAKYFQNHFKDRTRHILSNRLLRMTIVLL